MTCDNIHYLERGKTLLTTIATFYRLFGENNTAMKHRKTSNIESSRASIAAPSQYPHSTDRERLGP